VNTPLPLINDELDLLSRLLPLDGLRIVELGCGGAHILRALVQRYPTARATGFEVDERQHAKNLSAPLQGLSFEVAGAQAIPLPDASVDLVLMLKSLHHVPLPLLSQALAEVARVLRPGGHLYVSEPVYAGPLNDVVRLFNDEGTVRAAAQAALDAALASAPESSPWRQVAEERFVSEVHFRDLADFEQRMMRPTFADHQIDEDKLAAVASALRPHLGAGGAHFTRPMHVRLLQRQAAVELPAPPAADKPFSNPAATWNQRFASAQGYLFGTEPNAWVREHGVRWQAGQRVLCVADGEGRNSVWLAQRGVVVDAFDIAEQGVAKARRLAAERGVQVNFSVADCDSHPWPEAAYDGVAAIFVQFADPALRRRLFAHIRRCLKPGGTLLLQGYTSRQLAYKTGGPGQLSHLYTEALLREELAGMDFVTLREYDAEVDEGRGHSGLSALIGLVARQP
jgi:SAM-dependent methyltransferase